MRHRTLHTKIGYIFILLRTQYTLSTEAHGLGALCAEPAEAKSENHCTQTLYNRFAPQLRGSHFHFSLICKWNSLRRNKGEKIEDCKMRARCKRTNRLIFIFAEYEMDSFIIKFIIITEWLSPSHRRIDRLDVLGARETRSAGRD